MGNRKSAKPPVFVIRNKPQLEPATVVKNATIAAMIEKNSQSTLFKCPREIRDEIWAYLVGFIGTIHLSMSTVRDKKCGALFHLYCECDILLRYEICHPKTKHAALNRNHKPDHYRTLAGKSMTDHKFCWQDHAGYRPKSSRRIDLNFLFSCRQLYLEATEIIYKQTLFSFRSPDALSEFILSRNQFQRLSLRKIHLAAHWEWRSLLSKTSGRKVEMLVDRLKSIKTLQISCIRSTSYRMERAPFAGLIKFRVLDLESVTIDTSDIFGAGFSVQDAEKFRDLLLDSNGAEMQREKKDVKRVKGEKRRVGMDSESLCQSRSSALFVSNRVSRYDSEVGGDFEEGLWDF